MTKGDFEDLVKNISFYSEILDFKATEDLVLFNESNSEGHSEIENKKKFR